MANHATKQGLPFVVMEPPSVNACREVHFRAPVGFETRESSFNPMRGRPQWHAIQVFD